MWYEVLPSAGIILAAMAFPHYSAYVMNYLALGNCYRRGLEKNEYMRGYLRDRRLTDNPYKIAGLEAIKD